VTVASDQPEQKIARLIYHSEQFEPATGKLKSGAFPLDDVVVPARGGWSVVVLSKCTLSELNGLLRKFLRDGDDRRSEFGASTAIRGCVEQDFDPDGGPFILVDDPLPGNASHALIKISRAIPESRLRGLRKKLMDCFSPVTSAEAIFASD
jgi:hypothetical protein